MSQKEPHITSNVHVEKTDTLTNITESVELPSNLRTDLTVGTATEEALSPRQSLDFSAENTTEDTSVVDPLDCNACSHQPGRQEHFSMKPGIQLSSSWPLIVGR